MILVEEALARLLKPLSALAAEDVTLPEAFGRVLAEDVASRRTQPPSSMSAMDGYAVRAADLDSFPARLLVVGAAPAGSAFDGIVGTREAVRIFTGAPVPQGADSIVIQEDTERDGDYVVVPRAVTKFRHIRPEGQDFKLGSVELHAGKRLTARDIGLAAAMDRPWLRVHRRPRVAILATGNEIVLPGEPAGPNQIVSSNSFALGAFVTACGGIPVQLGIAPDDKAALQRLADGARGADLLVTTGGASVGDHDLVREALGATGLELDFWQIALRPGKPLMVGRYKDTPMVGLPGNPVSTMVCALLFLKPALERLSGLVASDTDPATARLARPLPASDRRQDYLRASLRRAADGLLEANPFETQDSSLMGVLARSDCLVIRPPHAPAAKTGDMVPVLMLGGGVFTI